MPSDFKNILTRIEQFFSGASKEGVVGIDIGTSSIKVVELHNNKEVPTLDTYGELQLGPYADIEIGRKTNLDVAKLTQALVDVVRESAVKTDKAGLAISYNASFVTVITLPTTDQQELAKLVPKEAKKYIPVPINTVSLDWFVVGQSADGSKSRVLIAAIHNDALKKYQATTTAAGLSIQLTEIEVFSIIRTTLSQRDAAVAVLDLGASGTQLYIVNNGTLMKSHNIRTGGAALTKLLSETMGISFDQAEVLKRTGLDVDSEGYKVVSGELDRTLKEAGRAIQKFETDEEAKIEKVILSGGGSLLANVLPVTQEALGKPVERSNPFSKVAYPSFLEDVLTEAGPVFSVAIGVALQHITNKG